MNMKYNFLRFPGGKAKAVTLSYDDGCCDDVKLVEILNKYGMKCTFNLIGQRVEREEPLSVDFIRENILAHGHEIANHGYMHRAQNRVRPLEGIRDIIDCRLTLERTFGRIVRGFAFPDCAVDRSREPDTYEKIRGYLSQLEIAYARSFGADNDKFDLPEDWYCWMPTAHHDNPEIMNYTDAFLSLDVASQYVARRDPKLFYLWGHAFELQRRQNWEHLEEICQKLSGREDVWYATNIEIHDYVEAYRHLRYSADGSTVYNPTLYDIWFDIDKKLYCIKPGETLTIGE